MGNYALLWYYLCISLKCTEHCAISGSLVWFLICFVTLAILIRQIDDMTTKVKKK